jgi:excisionase family DNA binding protein
MLLNINELSQLLHVKSSTLYAWVKQGKIPHLKIHGLIRFQANEIQQWLASFHPQNANPLKLKEKKGRGVNHLDTIIVRAKEEAYNSRHGETRPRSSPIRKEAADGAV